ncbi:hypothetical protein DFP95_1486 [Cohnella lupini]|uniref:Uncharacterized protein n=1 Tax=Cohnella lupini TaxID=1294267 RepID=A0A3D9HNR5_9BACL|nr:hypothetical protein DFP95_1486 [Cohnella lupini]
MTISHLNYYRRKPWFFRSINIIRLIIALNCLVEILLIKFVFKTEYGSNLIGQICYNSFVLMFCTFFIFILKERNKETSKKGWRIFNSWFFSIIFTGLFLNGADMLIKNIIDSYNDPTIKELVILDTRYSAKGTSKVITDNGTYKLIGNINTLETGNHYSFAVFKYSNLAVKIKSK